MLKRDQPIRTQVAEQAFQKMAKAGAKEIEQHLRQRHFEIKEEKLKAGQEAKGSFFDFGDPTQFNLSDNERAFLELNPQFLNQKYYGYNLDGKALGKKQEDKAPAGMVAVSNFQVEEVPWDKIGQLGEGVDIETLLAGESLKTSKLKLVKAKEGNEERYFLLLHALSGDAEKDLAARAKEIKVVAKVAAVFQKLGIPLYFQGDFQDPTYQKVLVTDPQTGKATYVLQSNAQGHMVHSPEIADRLNAFNSNKVGAAAFQDVVYDKTRGPMDEKRNFTGPNYRVSQQGRKNGVQSLTMGVGVVRLDERKEGDVAPNSDYLKTMPTPPSSELLDFLYGYTGSCDHPTVTLVDEHTETSMGACTSNRSPKGPNDQGYKESAYHYPNGRKEVRPEVGELETFTTEMYYERLILAGMLVKITNPQVNPYTGKLAVGEEKSNQTYQNEFRKTVGRILGIENADTALDYSTKAAQDMVVDAVSDFDQTNSENLVKVHEALEDFFRTQALGDGKTPFDPYTLPPQGDERSYNPALSQAIYDANKRFLKSKAMKDSYFEYAKKSVHPTQEQMQDEAVMKAHMDKLMTQYNQPSRGNSARSPVDKMFEANFKGMQNLAGFVAINGSTVESPESLEEKQLATHACEAAISRYKASTVKSSDSHRRCVFRCYTEASEYEHPAERESKPPAQEGLQSRRSEAYAQAFNAAECFIAKLIGQLNLNYASYYTGLQQNRSIEGVAKLAAVMGQFGTQSNPSPKARKRHPLEANAGQANQRLPTPAKTP